MEKECNNDSQGGNEGMKEEAADTLRKTKRVTLTNRVLQIATLVACGHTNKQIADKLRISEWTVSTHLRRIFVKRGVNNRAAMVYQCAGRLSLS
jgi:DNA-binding NarL/FixJ family response regulator